MTGISTALAHTRPAEGGLAQGCQGGPYRGQGGRRCEELLHCLGGAGPAAGGPRGWICSRLLGARGQLREARVQATLGGRLEGRGFCGVTRAGEKRLRPGGSCGDRCQGRGQLRVGRLCQAWGEQAWARRPWGLWLLSACAGLWPRHTSFPVCPLCGYSTPLPPPPELVLLRAWLQPGSPVTSSLGWDLGWSLTLRGTCEVPRWPHGIGFPPRSRQRPPHNVRPKALSCSPRAVGLTLQCARPSDAASGVPSAQP